MLDFQKLKETIPIIEVLGMLEIKHLTVRGDTLRGCCPLCRHEDPRAFIVTPAKNTWYCFKEKQGGDIIRLVARAKDLKDRDAAQLIHDHFNGTGKAAENAEPKHPRPEVSTRRNSSGFDPLAYLQTLDPDHDSLGIDGGILRKFRGGYSSKGLNRGRLVLPIIGAEGEIKAFVGIALKGEDPDLLYPKGYDVPYYMGIEHITAGTLTVVHHPVDMLKAYEGGLENIIALLRPITTSTLKCLWALMDDRKCTELEFV